jgi:ABC-type multidrug transport system fused ATPase/permease subunit
MKTYARLLAFLKPYLWPYFSLAMACMIGFGASDGVLPFLVQRIMDDVFTQKNQTALTYLPGIIVGIFARVDEFRAKLFERLRGPAHH